MSAKYPRTLHLPFSPGKGSDDKVMSEKEFESFVGEEIIFSEKLDGSNVCLTKESCFSRSHFGPPTHASFNGLKEFHKMVSSDLDPNLSVFAEWACAVHSIRYSILPSYLFIIGVRNDLTGEWWSYDEVKVMSEWLRAPTVPMLLRGQVGDKAKLKKIILDLASLSSIYGKEREGVVISKVSGITADDSNRLCGVGKMVRAGHVQTSEHWLTQKIEKQPLL